MMAERSRPLSEIARKALSTIQARATRNGIDFFEELNRVGLIATKTRIQEIEIAALRNLLDRLRSLEPAGLLHVFTRGNSNPATPADMMTAIDHWIDLYIKTLEND